MQIGLNHMKNSMKSSRRIKTFNLYCIALALLFFSAVLGLLIGSTRLELSELISAILSNNTANADLRILLYVRLPRVISAIICGMALSVSGAVIQAVLANRLASPSIIGVNSGAGLAVTLCSAFGIIGGWKLALFSFLGALLAAGIVSLGAKKWEASTGTVILLGVAINAFLGAISDTVVTFAPEVSIMSNDFKIGDFSSVTYARIIPAALVILVCVFLLSTLSNELDVLTLGDENAKGLGLNTNIMRAIFIVLAALLAGSAVSVCGLLSFVGLLVPHAVRRISSSESKSMIPLCALFGAGFVTLCDTLSRVIFAPYEIPVGIIMAFLGAPFFIFILIKGKGGRGNA